MIQPPIQMPQREHQKRPVLLLVYVCRECGHWQNVSLAQAFAAAFEPFAKWCAHLQGATYQESEQGYACPDGHGLMVQVTPKDRLFLRQAIIEETLRDTTTDTTEATTE